MAGGTAFYFSNALSRMNVKYRLVTAVASDGMAAVGNLRMAGVEVDVLNSGHTVYFENIYEENQDHRTQRVLRVADPFSAVQLAGADARFFHLGPLLAGDMPLDLIRGLAGKGRISLDAQGYLRKVVDQRVVAVDWPEKREALRYIDILKTNEAEMAVLTGQSGIRQGARMLAEWGVREVVITLGSQGSVIYMDQRFYDIPAYVPTTSVVDATGCGDTYMAGYLYQRSKGVSVQGAGEFAAAMATLKIEASGPFTGTEEDVADLLSSRQATAFVSR
jgi:sugar/nucleoside kinase (ribokinase family)